MNILFSAGYLSNVPFANNNIEILLADTLAKRGHTCFVTGVSHDISVDRVTNEGAVVKSWGINPIYKKATDCLEKTLENFDVSEHSMEVKKFIFKHPIYAAAIFVLKTEYPYKTINKRYIKKIKSLIKDKNIDSVISFCYPFDMVKLIFDEDLSVNKLYYQFDPYGMHETLNVENRDTKIKEEAEVIRKSKATITTQVLAKQYAENENYSLYKDKILGVDFPVLAKKQVKNIDIPFEFSNNNTNILFCGTIDDGFRNPDFVLKCFEQVFARDNSIKIYFLGPQQGVKVKQWAEKYPNNIFYHPGVENSIAVETTLKADMLLNIGNAISNMVPSKIFDYFATGKPIINVQKIANSPDMDYFEKYPLKITLNEFENKIDGDKLYDFICQNKNKQIDFSEVEKLFYTATPEFVADMIEKNLK